MTLFLIRFYAILIHLYPPQFRAEFGDEMVAVFSENLTDRSSFQAVILFLYEIRDLPRSLLEAFTESWSQGGKMTAKNEYIVPSTRWQAFIGTLPFLTFGIASLIDKTDFSYPLRFILPHLVCYGLALSGLLIGWIRGFPLWSYSYLGWSLVFAWEWTNIGIYGTNWGYYIWIPFGLMILIALLWTRSLDPIKKQFRDMWNDWTRLSLTMFAFGSFISLSFDDNHHPYLLLFILVSTMVVSAGAWLFLRSKTIGRRVLSIIVSFIGTAILTGISYATWDWRAYYGLPPVDRSINSLGLAPIGVLFWLLLLFWPAIIAAIRKILPQQRIG